MGYTVSGYYRKKKVTIYVKNDFNGGYVYINNAIQSSGSQYLEWWLTKIFRADDQEYQGISRAFDKWITTWGLNNNSTDEEITLENLQKSSSYTAQFHKEYDITVTNSFTGVGVAGQVKINGNIYNAPKTISFKEGRTIIIQAMFNYHNGIEYLFDEWSDGVSTASRTITVTGDQQYTATFNGRPEPVTMTSTSGTPGDNIHLEWQVHTNPNVTLYKIYRQVKPYNPTCIATKSRTQTSYTDWDYAYTSGYSDDLIWYDVRAYYSIESSYATPTWHPVFGKEVIGHDTEYSLQKLTYEIANYPNPFNPSTEITFSLPDACITTLDIYNCTGQRVKEMFDRTLHRGQYRETWDGTNNQGVQLPSGVYVARLTAKNSEDGQQNVLTRRLLLMK